jgi:hypothetical protein
MTECFPALSAAHQPISTEANTPPLHVPPPPPTFWHLPLQPFPSLSLLLFLDNFFHDLILKISYAFTTSVGDPEPDPNVFGRPGSGSISQRYGSGSGSFPFLSFS